MSILLLLKGDKQAKDILRKAIVSHYGDYPTAFSAINLKMTGRILQSVGSMNMWLPLDLDVHFYAPSKFRQDYTVYLFKLPVLKKSEVFDGQSYMRKNCLQSTTKTSEHKTLAITYERLWAYSTMLLIPINEPYVELTYVNDHCIKAKNLQTNITATIDFYENYQLKQITTYSDIVSAKFELQLSPDTDCVSGAKLFKEISVRWNDKFRYNLYLTQIEFEDEFDPVIFQIN